MRPVVLVVDDDAGVRYTLRELLEGADMEVAEAGDGIEALEWLADGRADLVITDLLMPRMDGMELLSRLAEMPQTPRSIVITAHGSERQAVDAMKRGAIDYFAKPFDVDQVLAVVERAVSAVRRDQENEELRAELALSRRMVFRSAAMRKLALLVHRVAPRDVTVLITGPTGTGKELVAEAIVAASPRAGRQFVRFNCAAIPRDLAESELFGHARGAFTGAVRSRPGIFREADGGTLFLDEVGELDPSTQGKLLRVLEERTFRPVGEEREHKVDLRIVAATNRDLATEVREKRFREDLFYRLGVVEIRVPPLSERLDDIPPLVDHFLEKFAGRFGTGPLELAPALRERILGEPWPGNVRELENRIERLVALSSGPVVDDVGGRGAAVGEEGAAAGEPSLKERVDGFERGLIASELRRCGGNRSETARRMRVSRVTLLEKMKRYGLG